MIKEAWPKITRKSCNAGWTDRKTRPGVIGSFHPREIVRGRSLAMIIPTRPPSIGRSWKTCARSACPKARFWSYFCLCQYLWRTPNTRSINAQSIGCRDYPAVPCSPRDGRNNRGDQISTLDVVLNGTSAVKPSFNRFHAFYWCWIVALGFQFLPGVIIPAPRVRPAGKVPT